MPETDKTMLQIRQGGQLFNLRAAAVVIHEGAVLLHRAEHDSFWAMPGGRIQMGETGEEALRREMLEEVGLAVSITRLMYVAEEFFTNLHGTTQHELVLYYAVTLPEDAALIDKMRVHEGIEESGTLQPQRLIFQWFPVETLTTLEMPLHPAFLRTKLVNPPQAVEHIVRID